MAKCPIMSYQNNQDTSTNCLGDRCAWYDNENNRCCIKTMAIAAANKKDGGSSSTAQAYYIPPSSYCQTNAISNTEVCFKPPAVDTSYITF